MDLSWIGNGKITIEKWGRPADGNMRGAGMKQGVTLPGIFESFIQNVLVNVALIPGKVFCCLFFLIIFSSVSRVYCARSPKS